MVRCRRKFPNSEKKEVISRMRDDYLQGLPVGTCKSAKKYGYSSILILDWLKKIDPVLYQKISNQRAGTNRPNRRQIIGQMLDLLNENPNMKLTELAKKIGFPKKDALRSFIEQESIRGNFVSPFMPRFRLYHFFVNLFPKDAKFKSLTEYSRKFGIHKDTASQRQRKIKALKKLLRNMRENKKLREEVSEIVGVEPDFWRKTSTNMAVIQLIWNYGGEEIPLSRLNKWLAQ